jgi:hypothetical protein
MQPITPLHSGRHGEPTGAPCCDGGRSCFPFGLLERPRYYPRQLMTPGDLTLEAEYFRDRMRRHNIYLHGWGVVCGALVCVVPAKPKAVATGAPGRISASEAAYEQQGQATEAATASPTPAATEPWLVRVEPGYILGPYGDEITIDCAREVSLRGAGVSGCGEVSSARDPWCSEVYVSHTEGPRFIAVRYHECQVRPVRAQPAACGCDEMPCEYSRFRDGYEIGILDHCPDSHRPVGRPITDQPQNPACPDCPESPWVVLAEVEVDSDGAVTKIDNCSCRRIVYSARELWAQCAGTDCDEPRTEWEWSRVPAYREPIPYEQPGSPPTVPEPEPPPGAGEGPAEVAEAAAQPVKRAQKRAPRKGTAKKTTPRKRTRGDRGNDT